MTWFLPCRLQGLGGWRTIGMVERYGHLTPAHKAEAVERIAVEFHYAIHYTKKALVADRA